MNKDNKRQTEMSVIATLIKLFEQNRSQAEYVMLDLSPEMFNDSESRAYFSHISELNDRNKDITQALMTEHIHQDLLQYHVMLSDVMPVRNIRDYIDELKTFTNDYKKFLLMRDAVNAVNNTDCIQSKQETIQEYYERLLETHSNPTGTDNAVNMVEVFDDIEQGNIDVVKRYYTGLDNLDWAIGGFERGTFSVLAGDTGTGKTQLALALAMRLACQNTGEQIVIFSMEINREKLAYRLAGLAYGKNYDKLTDAQKIEAHAKVVRNPVYVYDDQHVTVSDVIKKIRLRAQKMPIGVIVVDYIGLIETAIKHDRYDMDLKYITQELVKIANEYDCFVLVPQQVNRQADERLKKDEPPRINDLADTKDTARYAHYVITFMQKEGEPFLNFCVRKNRSGERDKQGQLNFNDGIINNDPIQYMKKAYKDLKREDFKNA